MSILLPEEPWSDCIADALAESLESHGLPDLRRLLDLLLSTAMLEVTQPEAFWIGQDPQERAACYCLETAQVRSLLLLELARLGDDSPILTPPGLN